MNRESRKVNHVYEVDFTKIVLGGILLGLGWSVLYSFILQFSEKTVVPIIHAMLYGAIFGTCLGLVNGTMVLLFTNGKDYSQKASILSVTVTAIITFIISIFFSPSIFHLLINVLVASLGSLYLIKFILNNKVR